MSVLPTTLSLETAGIPSNNPMALLLQQASTSSDQVKTAYSAWFGVSNLFENAAFGGISWIASTTQPGNHPVLYIQQGLGENINAAILTLFPFENVTNGTQAPEVFESEGTTYNQIGAVVLNVNISNAPAYVALLKVGVEASASFEGVDWTQTFAPVLPTLAQACNAAFAPANTSSKRAILLEVGGFTKLAQGVSIILKVIQIVKMVYTIVEHPSTFQTLILNAGDSDITFNDYYLDDAGEKFYADTQGQEIQDLASYILPAPIVVTLPNGSSMNLIQVLSGKQVSAKNLSGTGIAFTCTSNNNKAAALINIPFASENKIHAEANFTGTAEDFWEDHSGDSSGTTQSITLGDNATFAMAIDALSGKQPGEDGLLAYFYNTVLAFSPITDPTA